MAIQKNIDYKAVFTYSGNPVICEKHEIVEEIRLNNCYIVITNVQGQKDKMAIDVSTYTDHTKEKLVHIKRVFFTPSVEDGAANFIKQGYEYLKTLPEYANALDVLEDGQML